MDTGKRGVPTIRSRPWVYGAKAVVVCWVCIVAMLWYAPSAIAVNGTTADGYSHLSKVDEFHRVIEKIESLPYQPAYVPVGLDQAFAPALVLNTFPQEDYTTGSIPGSPDSPAWPSWFHQVLLRSPDGAEFYAEVALHEGTRPGLEVVPGFNTHSKRSVIRWAALAYYAGYNVIAADQRDYYDEYEAGLGYPKFPQTFGWKEAEDVVTAGRYLKEQPGVSSLGIVGFSEGGENTVLAMAQAPGLYQAGLTFSGPADQDPQIYSTAVPSGCTGTDCAYPVTDALVALVVPPYTYTNVCQALDYAGSYYHTSVFNILAHESAFKAQTFIHVPLLNFYAADDPLVKPFQAKMMAGYEVGNPLQDTIEIQHGLHAYYNDRWWQQEAILQYFKAVLPGAVADSAVTTRASVNQTPGGAPLRDQLVGLGRVSRQEADSYLAPDVCDTALGSPGASAPSAPVAQKHKR